MAQFKYSVLGQLEYKYCPKNRTKRKKVNIVQSKC